MIIFIHGTVKPAEFSFSNLMKIIRDEVDNTLYSLGAKYIRQDPLFHKMHIMQDEGLHPIILPPTGKTCNAAQLVAQLYNIQFEHFEKEPIKNIYYTFGWNGLLSKTKRYQEAVFFYDELTKELKKLKQQGINPSITIIAYSHGANVVLYLPSVRDENPRFKQYPLSIDQLVLIATPIQKETDHFSADPMFKQIYNIYSTEDSIQVLDLLSSHRIFSDRIFTNRRDFKIPPKIQQIRFRVVKDIKRKRKARNLKAKHEVLTHPKVKLIHKDPGHTEMWAFHWGSYWYRDTFPLRPLPGATFIPTILYAADTHKAYKNLTFTLAPEQNSFSIKSKKDRFQKSFQFLPDAQKNELWETAREHRPEDCNLKIEKEHVGQALKKAQEELERLNKYRAPHNKALAHYMKEILIGNFNVPASLPEQEQLRLAHND